MPGQPWIIQGMELSHQWAQLHQLIQARLENRRCSRLKSTRNLLVEIQSGDLVSQGSETCDGHGPEVSEALNTHPHHRA